MGTEGRKITNIGLFQTGKGVRITGISILAVGLCMVVFACVQFFVGDIFTLILLLAVGIYLVLIGITNIIVVSKLRSKDFTKGEAVEIIVLDGMDKHTKYVAFVESDRKCSNHADTVSEEPKDTAE